MTGILAGSVLATLPMPGAVARAEGGPGSWAATLSPSTACAGSTVTFTFSFTNNGSDTLKSAFLQAPDGFVVPGGQPGVTVSTFESRAVAGFRLVDIAPGASKVVSFNAVVGLTPGDQSWVAEAESLDHNFENDPGDDTDDFQLTSAQPVTTVAAGCKLVFTAQPADAGKDKTITSVALNDSPGAPIALAVRDSGNVLVPIDTSINVALHFLNDSAAPGLTPTLPVDVLGGVTTLAPQVSIASATKAYKLLVTAPTDSSISPATSVPFQIWDAAKTCTTSDCTLTTGGPANTFTVTPNTSQAGAGIGATLNLVNLDCSPLKYGGFSPIPGTQTFGWVYTGGGFKTETILVGKSLLTSKLLLVKALIYQVCYSAPVQFTTYFGLKAQPDPTVSTVMGVPFYTGLLRPCLSSDPTSSTAKSRAPCVLSRQWTPAGEVVKILSPDGDPYSR